MEENGNGRDKECRYWLGERATRLAQDRAIWRDLVDALYPIRSQLFIAWTQAVGCRVEKTGTRNEVAITDSRG